jgi:membrane protease YdiL (CAAX protease family)
MERAASWSAIRQPRTWGWIVLITAGVFVFSNGVTVLARTSGVASEPSNLVPIQGAMAVSPLFLTLFVVLLAPAYEELLFRRVLFGRLWAAGWPWLGMVLSSAGFALIHEFPGFNSAAWLVSAPLLLAYGAMGMAFAWLYRRTGTLWAPVAAHALNNAVALLVLWLGLTKN